MATNIKPFDDAAERTALGLMMSDLKCLKEGVMYLVPDHFYKPHHRLIFASITALFIENKQVTLLNLTNYLKARSALDAAGGPLAIAELLEYGVSATEFPDTLLILKDKHTKRRLIDITGKTQTESFNDKNDGELILRGIIDELWTLTPKGNKEIKIIHPEDIYQTRMDDLKNRAHRKVVHTSYPGLDELLVAGFAPQEISVIAGRPGVGKSSFKSNLIVNLCNAGLGVVHFAIEQGFSVESDRLESIMTDIPLKEIMNSREWRKGDYRIPMIKEANKLIAEKWNYHIIPSRGLIIPDVRFILNQISRDNKIDVVFFDLFDKLKDVNVSANKAQHVGEKLGMVHTMSEEFDCHMSLLVQINRNVEKRPNKRPVMSDLKDSGSYEQDARLVMLLYREKYYNNDSLDETVEVIIGKQNNGPSGSGIMAPLIFHEDTLKMTSPVDYFGVG